MAYSLPLFRPPSEAESLILQVTLGCSHNRCTFCAMYRGKRFSVRREEEVLAEIREARAQLGAEVPRVFLADGDAFCLSPRRLTPILEGLRAAFPALQRVSAYANARDVLAKSEEELALLRERGLRLLYLGLESGDEETLARSQKGASVEEIVEAARRARRGGIAVSAMVLCGLAGRERSLLHARASAEALNRMEPSYAAALTAIPVPGTPFHDAVESGALELPTPRESLLEIRELIAGLRCRTYFTCNHASNYLPLTGRLPGAQARLLGLLDAALAGQLPLKPEWLRGL
jgi:radical SAM superfamily enzyme YgiQ (UPF0313 family)